MSAVKSDIAQQLQQGFDALNRGQLEVAAQSTWITTMTEWLMLSQGGYSMSGKPTEKVSRSPQPLH